jgi:hypothetical protein
VLSGLGGELRERQLPGRDADLMQRICLRLDQHGLPVDLRSKHQRGLLWHQLLPPGVHGRLPLELQLELPRGQHLPLIADGQADR